MASSKPMTDAQRLAVLCEQAIGELQAERRAARTASEKKQLGTQIAVMRDMLGWAKAARGNQAR